jgi:uncharacterized membrane protein SpoIIM required for sporulation
MNWGHVVRNAAIAIAITFAGAIGVYLAIRFLRRLNNYSERTRTTLGTGHSP